MSSIAVTDPRTGAVVELFDVATPAEVEECIHSAAEAVRGLQATSFAQRSGWMHAASAILRRDRDDIARDIVEEMGKPLTQALAEVDKCAGGFRFYAEQAEAMLADAPVAAEEIGASQAYVRWEPLGVVLAVMPWNFPLWQAVRFIAPALMAGNAGLLKHASNVPRSAMRLERVIQEAGFPRGSLRTLLISSGDVEKVLRDPRVRAVTLTGSEAAGRAVAAIAGDEVKPSLLELGGSDAFVVLAGLTDTDLDRSAEVAVTARCQNNGQSCIAAKRFVIEAEIHDEWVIRLVAGMQALRVGDPFEPSTQIGPLVNEAGRDEIVALVADAVDKGAHLRCGGIVPDGPGWFYPPTVLTGVTDEMRVFHEEVFGPVALVLRAQDEFDALRLANATTFGLGSAVWTRDPEQQQRFIDGLEAGAVFVNGMVTSYPQLGFGGIKRSGYGRELADLGIKAFCNAKTVWIG